MTPDSVRQEGIEKWQTIVDLIDMGVGDEHLVVWWEDIGTCTCSFCRYYCAFGGPGCQACPLRGGTCCSPHWEAINDSCETLPALKHHAPLMLKQIMECE